MLNFVHDIPTRYYFGEGQISNLAGELSRFGKNVLLTYGGGSVKRSGLYDTIMDILNGQSFFVEKRLIAEDAASGKSDKFIICM